MELSPVLSMYKRCSKYTTQTHTCRPEVPADFGQLVEMEIPRYGDFIKTMFVKMTLPPTYGKPNTPDNRNDERYMYTGSPGLHIFEYVELVIGDKVIERLDGYLMALYFMKRYGPLYNDVFDSAFGGNPEQHFEYIPANGLSWYPYKYPLDGRTEIFGLDEDPVNSYTDNRNRTIFYPLPFYFFNKSSLAVPICLLHKQEIKLRFKFRNWQELIITDGDATLLSIYARGAGRLAVNGLYTSFNKKTPDYSTIFGPLKLVDFSVPVEFAYISDDDYKFISSKPCTHLINQTQRQVISVQSDVFNISTILNFINPVKCIDFFVKYKNNERLYYRNLYNMKANYARIRSGKASLHHIESIQLEFDGETFLSNTIANYQFLTYVQKYKHNIGFYNYTRSDSFETLNPYATVFTARKTFMKFDSFNNPEIPPSMYSKVCTGPYYSYSFALDPFSEKPCGYMNFSTIRTPIIKINMFSDKYVITSDQGSFDLLSEPREVYVYADTINILTFDPIKGNATLKFQNPTYT